MKVGDIVSCPRKYLPKWRGDNFAGDTYGVCFEEPAGIEFLEPVGGHDGGRDDLLKSGSCWFVDESKLKLIEEAYD